MMLKAYRNGLWVRGTGSSADHKVSASQLLGRAHGYGMGKEKGGGGGRISMHVQH